MFSSESDELSDWQIFVQKERKNGTERVCDSVNLELNTKEREQNAVKATEIAS